jgi:hypothetical protein
MNRAGYAKAQPTPRLKAYPRAWREPTQPADIQMLEPSSLPARLSSAVFIALRRGPKCGIALGGKRRSIPIIAERGQMTASSVAGECTAAVTRG